MGTAPLRRRAVALLALVLLPGLVACDSGEGEDRAAATSPGTTVPSSRVQGVDPPVTTAAPPVTTVAPSTTTIDLTPTDERGEPVAPSSAAELAARLAAVLEGVPGCAAAGCGELGHHHQVLVRALANEPSWRGALHEHVEPAWLEVTDLLVRSGTAAADSIARPLEAIPAWRIRPPLPADELRSLYDDAEAATGTPWEVLAAVNLVETRMGRIVGLSSAGAQGPMQFIPSTWDLYGEGGDPFDDADAIAAAARLLAATGAPDDVDAALYAYNPSEAYVAAVRGYADALVARPELYGLLWGWQVYVLTTEGTLWLPEGFETAEPLPAADHVGAR